MSTCNMIYRINTLLLLGQALEARVGVQPRKARVGLHRVGRLLGHWVVQRGLTTF